LTGEKLSEFQVVAALNEAQRNLGLRLGSFLVAPAWDDPPYYVLLVEEGDVLVGGPSERLAAEAEACLRRVNVEYDNRRSTLRLGPIRVARIVQGSWAQFQKRRLARSGGTVEQYKQPHLVPDLNAAATFAFVGSAHPVGTD
jgi:hypothetical protein